MIRCLALFLLLASPAVAEEELTPTFPAPETELTPTFPAPEAEVEPAFPAPEAEVKPAFPAPEGDAAVAPAFPAPAGDDDDSSKPAAAPAPTPLPPPEIAAELLEVFNATEQLAARIEAAENSLVSLAMTRMAASTPSALKAADEEIAELNADVSSMRSSLRQLASGLDPSMLSDEPEDTISWEEELTELLSPILHEVKRATERPRETERLRIRQAHYAERIPLFDEAIVHVEGMLPACRDPLHRNELEQTLGELTEARDKLRDELEVAQGAMANLQKDSDGVMGALSNVMRVFFADRGRNVMTAVAAFLGVLLVMILMRRALIGILRRDATRTASLWVRVLELLAAMLAVVMATAAGLTVLFVSGDWVLLTVAALVLMGLFWGARASVPGAWSEIRLLLNVGPVREGERVIYEDLPWLVDSLQFVSILRNPAFPGVYIRLPLGDLDGMVSRPFLPEEPWFPTKVGDWIDTGDDGWGQVVFQSPEIVQARISGVLRNYPAADFASEPPVNLSTGWRSDVLLTLDYQHQDEITGSIPERLEAFLNERFASHVLAPHLDSLSVGFEQMGESSLDLEISGWFRGSGAEHWEIAAEDIAALCVDACNKYGWVIAFPQLQMSKRD